MLRLAVAPAPPSPRADPLHLAVAQRPRSATAQVRSTLLPPRRREAGELHQAIFPVAATRGSGGSWRRGGEGDQAWRRGAGGSAMAACPGVEAVRLAPVLALRLAPGLGAGRRRRGRREVAREVTYGLEVGSSSILHEDYRDKDGFTNPKIG
ncbi:hypothetical protein EJB05_32848, partial [Eragrostis curvula]